ncbi:hypothetical protein F5Y10DRAFT_259495 [Nemania abortiva]|nr:hypothetical protein F5Y10DRAFT_259495 [Nemania abortiva]
MKDIYSRAERVLFCLTLPLTEIISPTSIFMESLIDLQRQTRGVHWPLGDQRWKIAWKQVQDMLKRRYGSDWEERQRRGLEEILNHSWFRRVWVLQEVANARRALICVGGDSVSSRIFVIGIQLMGVPLSQQTQAVISLMPGPSRSLNSIDNQDFYYLLVQFSESEASDERDRIFALQGLCTDESLPIPDYTITKETIMRRITKYLFGDNFSNLPALSPLPKDIGQYLSALVHICYRAAFESSAVDSPFLSHLFSKHWEAVLFVLQSQKKPINVYENMVWIAAKVEREGRLMGIFRQHGRELRIHGNFLVPENYPVRIDDAVPRKLRNTGDFHLGKETSEIDEDFDHAMKVIKSILQPGGAEVIIHVDLAELQELLLFIPDDKVGLAVKMVTGNDDETQFVIDDLLQSLYSSEKKFHRTHAIEILLRGREEAVTELLASAARLGADEVVEMLIRKGADLERRSQSGLTALGSAVAFGRNSTTKLLVEAGAISSGGRYGMSPLATAAANKRHAIAALLLDMGADIDARGSPDSPHLSALCAAVVSGDLRMVKLLLERNANPNTPSWVRTPVSGALGDGVSGGGWDSYPKGFAPLDYVNMGGPSNDTIVIAGLLREASAKLL